MSIFMQQSHQKPSSQPKNFQKSDTTNSANFDVVIIGAGASGLFCASQIARSGKSVAVLDHANKAGKKILMSGGGRCNFTNLDVGPENFISQNPHFVRSALANFTPDDFLMYVYQYGILFHEKSHGQLFCNHSSKDILDMLLQECHQYQVHILLNTQIDKIEKNTTEKSCHNHQFFIKTSPTKKNKTNAQPITITCQSLVIATGGLSIPTLGASAFGYQIARQFGHNIINTYPALCPLTLTDKLGELLKNLSGISLDVEVSNSKIIFNLPMLFTHKGLSGPAILQISNYWQLGESIFINLLPDINIADFLIKNKKSQPKQLIRKVLSPFFAKKLLSALEFYFWQEVKDVELANIKDSQLVQLGKTLNAWKIKPSGTEGYKVAEVTKGGVDTADVCSKTMQSKLVDDLYFIGEVLDVTGQLGGYNFQWAWASAYACASAITKFRCI